MMPFLFRYHLRKLFVTWGSHFELMPVQFLFTQNCMWIMLGKLMQN
jgi:hypothetical protein